MPDLSNCPFCGSEAEPPEEYETKGGHVRWRVVCLGCPACVSSLTPEEAIAAWNTRRASPPAAPAQEPVAWMDPESRDVINAERKHDWLTYFGDGGKRKAASYTAPLYATPAAPRDLSDEQIFDLAKQHFGNHGHDLIWKTSPDYAEAVGLDRNARWMLQEARPEQTIAFARAVLRAAHPEGVREFAASLGKGRKMEAAPKLSADGVPDTVADRAPISAEQARNALGVVDGEVKRG